MKSSQNNLQMAHSEIPALWHDNALLNKQAKQLRKMRELLRAENTENGQFKQKVQCLGTLISRERFRSKESSISERNKSGPGDVVMGIPGSGKSRKTLQCKVVEAGGVL